MKLQSIVDLYTIFLQYPTVVTDTRKLQKDCIFFALKGGNFNGNTFADEALEKGAKYVVIDEKDYDKGDNYILVEDVLTTLQALAKHHRQQSKATIIAITGSNGKTTTKELIAIVLQTQKKIIATVGNLNNHIGVPLTLLTIKEDTEIALIEMGANHQNEISEYCKWAMPEYGVITNVGRAHLEGFGSLEGVKKAKGELYQAIVENKGTIFRYSDVDYLKEMIGNTDVKQITYGTNDADYIGKAELKDAYLSAEISFPEKLKDIYSTQLIGEYNLPNILCAITIGDYFGIGKDNIKKALADYSPSNSRSQLLQKGTNQFILDAYNANPTSLQLAIENFNKINHENKWLLIGCMKEMGAESEAEHRKIVQLLKSFNFKNVFLVGNEYKNVADGFSNFEDSTQLAEYLKKQTINNALILVKGSRGAKMEEVMSAFEK